MRPDRPLRARRPSLPALSLAVLAAALVAPVFAAEPPALWPGEQREFFLDGPAYLLPEAERLALAAMGEAERARAIEAFLSAEGVPGVSARELALAIDRRRDLVRRHFVSPADVRARLLFLRGAPSERVVVDCGEVFVPLEVWSYPTGGAAAEGEAPQDRLVVFEPGPGRPWKLWVPYDTKRALYTDQLEYFLEQWEEHNNKLFYAERFDLQMCDETKLIDRVTGIHGLREFRRNRPDAEDFLRHLDPPAGLAAWVAAAIATPLPEGPEPLEAEPLRVDFPQRQGQRIVARFDVRLPEASELPTAPAEGLDIEDEELRLVVEGVVEEGGTLLDTFRVRFVLPPPPPGQPAVLLFGEPLRPEQVYMVRFRVTDEVSGRSVYLSEGFRVPPEPRESADRPPVPEEAVVSLGEALAEQQIAGADSLVLVPPTGDVVLALWRAEALVSGSAIEKVAFSVDGEAQLTDNKPPYTAELRLAQFPKEQVVRAEGLDRQGRVVDADEVVINQPRGAFSVRIIEPPPGVMPAGEDVEVVTQVVVPEGRRIADVRYDVDGIEVARLERPPWTATVHAPEGADLSYLSVTATLDDGRSAEDVRILNAPDFVEQVDVDLVELYAAVTGRDGFPVEGLTAEDFEVLVDGEPVEIARFEAVEDLPLTIGLVVDSSGSMASSLGEAMQAAREFLTHVIDLRDHAFSVGFASEPVLLMPPTSDVGAVADSLGRLRAVGWTALHDAVITGLYYFRGFPGQRVMVLLSDGDDTRSKYGFREVLEYARRGGVSVYTVGLNVGRLGGARGKLQDLATETGGRAFFIGEAEELRGVYGWLSDELRSRYMLAIVPPPSSEPGYRDVEVRVKRKGLDVRTARGIYR